MSAAELASLPALRQSELVRRRELKATELVAAYLERIEQHDGTLNSYVALAPEAALAQARALDEDNHASAGPLFGCVVSVKDVTEATGLPTSYSCASLAEPAAESDAGVVAKLRAAGCVVLGKTNVPELGMLPVTESALNGACRNPWDPERTPGGSSGGAGAALAGGLCSLSHANDGGGSIRIPAAYCGLVGVKPSRGRVSWGPRFADMVGGLGSPGPLGRTVADAAAMLDAMAGYLIGDPYWIPDTAESFLAVSSRPPARLRIALARRAPIGVPVDPECERALERIAALLEEAGHDVSEAAPAWEDPLAAEAFGLHARAISAYFGDPDEDTLEPLNRELLRQARATSHLQQVRTSVRANAFVRAVVAFWDEFDVLLTPATAIAAPVIGWAFEDPDPAAQFARLIQLSPFTSWVNLTGQPAVSVPAGLDHGGVPLGVQAVGRPGDEATLLSLAAELEEIRPWSFELPAADGMGASR